MGGTRPAMAVAMRALLVCLLGCSAVPPPENDMPIQLELGHRADGKFALYEPGQDVTLVAGAQGGFHVWLSYQMTPARSGSTMLERTAWRADGKLVLRSAGSIEPDGEPLPMFMCPAPVGLSVLDQPIEYRLRFLEGETELAKGSVTLVPHCPADNVELCQRICNG
jgi:hypothetical protein